MHNSLHGMRPSGEECLLRHEQVCMKCPPTERARQALAQTGCHLWQTYTDDLWLSISAPYPRTRIERNYTPPKSWCIAFSEGSSPEDCDFPQSWSAPNQTGDATLPLRWLPPATLLWTCYLGTPCFASCSQTPSFIKYAIFSIGNKV